MSSDVTEGRDKYAAVLESWRDVEQRVEVSMSTRLSAFFRSAGNIIFSETPIPRRLYTYPTYPPLPSLHFHSVLPR